MENELMEKSMQDKMIKMHIIAFEIESKLMESELIDNNKVKEKEMDLLYGILDGLTEEFIMNRITGHCSLQAMLDWPVEKLENIIDTNILELEKINNKYNFKINISDIDFKIANRQITID